ncbi:hypothetical protein MKW98_020447 [Papaver atlanticum]|uniref:GDSL esterase/lipase n=1 Tax=Papaver atlanticum TaxID=357466 RepID=A0AAD4RVL9_9MAGN|nr:hypothetical protein MKW98_020447 [Papaver atlanticum]
MANLVISELHRNLCFSFAFISFIIFAGAQVVPSIIVFGDSLLDVGNNNHLELSLAKANFPYNGVDFPKLWTGRFSNGRNAADFFSEKLRLPTSPPYLSVKKDLLSLKRTRRDSNAAKVVLQNGGISFASGGAGILNETNKIFVQSISLDEQIEFFSGVHGQLEQQLGKSEAESFLAKSVFLIAIGSNDIIGYSKPDSDLPGEFGSPENYMDILMHVFRGQLKRIYDLGARKFAIVGAALTGCCPSLRMQTGKGECNVEANLLSLDFNNRAVSLIEELIKTELLGIKYSFFFTHNLVIDIISQPAEQHGFTEVQTACCGRGDFNAEFACLAPVAELCDKRGSHLFWDLYHPTEAAAKMVIDRFFSATEIKYVFPINGNQLVGIA